MAQQIQESIWSKQDVSEGIGFKKQILNGEWSALEARWLWGKDLIRKKQSYRHGDWTEQLKLYASQVDYASDTLRQHMRFARIVSDFEVFKQEHPDPPSWNEIVHDLLFEPSDNSDSVTNSNVYPRCVLNLCKDTDKRDHFIFYHLGAVCDENRIDESEMMRRAILQYMDSHTGQIQHKPSYDPELTRIEDQWKF
jgi:hypothetical protein